MAAPMYPQIITECDFSLTGVWEDISPWVRGISIKRGSSRVESPILRYDAGTANVVLDNRDRRFDPTNLAGPYTSSFEDDSGVRVFTCEETQAHGIGWTVDIKSAVGQQAAIRNVSIQDTGTTGNSTISRPAGTASGDLMLFFHFCDIGPLTDMGAPTGGTSWGSTIASRSEGEFALQSKVYRKTAGGSEPTAYAVTQNSGADGVLIVVAVKAGTWDTGATPVIASQSNPETALAGTPATVPAGANDLEIRAVGGIGGGSGSTWEPPEGFDERADAQSGDYTTAALAARQLDGVGQGSDTQVKPMRPIRLRATVPFQSTTNLIRNPSFETGTTGWQSNGSSTIGRTTEQARYGGAAATVSKTEDADVINIELAPAHALSVSAGTQVTLSAHVLIPAAVLGQVTAISFNDATFDGSFATAVLDPPPTPDTWHRVSATVTVAPGETLTRWQLQVHTDGSHATGQLIALVDAVQTNTGTATPYCDGSLPACSWSGTAHASTSSRPSSFTFGLFKGFIDDWEISWQRGYDSEVNVPCTDGLGVLADWDRDAVAAVGAGETSDARIDRILDSLDWPSGDRQIGTGASTLQATTLEGNGLEELQLVTDSEVGELYVNGDGDVVFRGRRGVTTETRSTNIQSRWGDDRAMGELPFHEVGISQSKEQMYNLVRITRDGGATQSASDEASRDEFKTRSFDRDGLAVASDSEALSLAQWILSISRVPELRFSELDIRPQQDPASLFPEVLHREVGDRIRIVRRPVGGGDPIIRECFIRGIEHEIRGNAGSEHRWATKWVLQSAVKAGAVWTLDHPQLGKVDSNALGY